MDWSDMKHHTAYLHTTKDFGLTYHRRTSKDSDFFLMWASSDFGDRIFHDGTGILGNMVGGSDGPRGRSAPIIATSTKDNGMIAGSTPDGELKSSVNVLKTLLDMRVLAEDTGNPQVSPSLIETDSQAVILTAQDLSGKALAFRHRRRQLRFIISCVHAQYIKLKLVTTTLMTSDSMTKDYGPLVHWKRITHSLGQHPNLLVMQQMIINRWTYRKNSPSESSNQSLTFVANSLNISPILANEALTIFPIPKKTRGHGAKMRSDHKFHIKCQLRNNYK
jgi:hypothetical protein